MFQRSKNSTLKVTLSILLNGTGRPRPWRKIAVIAALIVRGGFYGQACPLKDDFIRGYRKKLESGQSLNLFVDQLITPTFIDDIARG